MNELAGDAQISFEGDLQTLGILSLPRATTDESNALKRNTLWPKQDYVVLPLLSETVGTVIAAMGETIPHAIIHIQIAKAGKLEFGAYDNFDPQSIFFGRALTQPFLDSLIAEGILVPMAE